MAHNGATRYFQTRFVVPSIDCLKNGVVVKVGNASYINQQLRSQMNRIYEVYDKIHDSDCYTCSQLLTLIENNINGDRKHTLGEIAIEWLKLRSITCRKNTYIISERSIRIALDYFGEGKLLQLINPIAIAKYDSFLNAKFNTNTVIMTMRPFKAFINYAVRMNYVKYQIDPFSEYRPKQPTIRQCALPVSVLRKIRDYQTSNRMERMAIDIFMLSFYLAGMNIEDLSKIDLSKDSVNFIRTKTNSRRNTDESTEFDIVPEARAIIDKYIDNDGRLKIFEVHKNKKTLIAVINTCLKTISQKIGYDGRMIYYGARKTFSQIAYSMKIQEKVILYCIGDSYKGKDMLSFYVKPTKKLANECIRRVIDFVNSEKTEDELE